MPLSNDLISRFVKITNDNKSKKTETTVYGTVKSGDNNTLYVALDGSDYTEGTTNGLIPVTQVNATTSVKENDRVTVLIRNHAAIITGNLKDPSTNKGYTDASVSVVAKNVSDLDTEVRNLKAVAVTTDQLDAKTANIKQAIIDDIDAKYIDTDELNANNATFKEVLVEELDAKYLKADKIDVEDLEAKVAKISGLEADNVEINEKLDAHTAVIENLDSKYATIERMDAAEADIDELEAKTAKIDVLESDVADINTLIFNNASGGTMHANFANAVIALLGSAWIKSAMIESVAADKIVGDIVITEDLEIVSDDGHVKIQNGVIQVLDDDKNVRVQLGKDASNNYSIAIWDANGNKMFDAGGITADAIKSDIIVNNMVSATADIDASKLNIDSLFNVINNDGTNTIKATRVQLDEKGQTLEVAFNTLNDEVDAQGTEIDVINGKIASKVWQQDIDDATDTMSTQYSELQQEVDGISATVASHTTQISKKADSSTVMTINNKVTSMESDLSGFKTTVGETYATKTALALTDTKASDAATAAKNAQSDVDDLSERVSSAETSISQNAEAIGLRATKTEVSTAKSEAISTASADATTKANNALSSANANTANALKSYSTTEQMNAAITLKADGITSSVSATYATKSSLATTNDNVTKAQTAANNAQADIDNLEIGGRNLAINTSNEWRELSISAWSGQLWHPTANSVNTFTHPYADYGVAIGDQITFGVDINANGKQCAIRVDYYAEDGTTHAVMGNYIAAGDTGRSTVTLDVVDQYIGFKVYIGSDGTVPDAIVSLYKCLKIEKGNKATDWTPATEDMATAKSLNTTHELAEAASTSITEAQSLIQQITNSISMLITDGNGTSLMTQTEDGWTFSTSNIQNSVNSISENLNTLLDDVGGIDNAMGILQQAVDELGVTAEYVRIVTYEGEPCVELGESDSDFKLRITNTQMMFTEGSNVLAYFTNQSMHIQKVVIEEELQQGNFVWKTRNNGNMGLVWKGGSS